MTEVSKKIERTIIRKEHDRTLKNGKRIHVKKSKPFKIKKYPDHYFTHIQINGENRLVEVKIKNGKRYYTVVEDRRLAKPISYEKAKKHFKQLSDKRQQLDKKYRSKNTLDKHQITSKYLSKEGTKRYDVEGLDTPEKSNETIKRAEILIKTAGDYQHKDWKKLNKEREETQIHPLPYDSIPEKFFPNNERIEFDKIYNILEQKGFKISSSIWNRKDDTDLELHFTIESPKEEYHKGYGKKIYRCRYGYKKGNKYYYSDSCQFGAHEISKEEFYKTLNKLPDFSEYLEKFPLSDYDKEKNKKVTYFKDITQIHFKKEKIKDSDKEQQKLFGKEWKKLSYDEKLDILDKVYDDDKINNLKDSIEQIEKRVKFDMDKVNKAYDKDTYQKYNEILKQSENDLEKANEQLKKREEKLKEKYLREYIKTEKLKEIHQYPYEVQQGIKTFLNITKMELEDIDRFYTNAHGNVTVIDKLGKEHKFSVG